jgi:hypothetical protein
MYHAATLSLETTHRSEPVNRLHVVYINFSSPSSPKAWFQYYPYGYAYLFHAYILFFQESGKTSSGIIIVWRKAPCKCQSALLIRSTS